MEFPELQRFHLITVLIETLWNVNAPGHNGNDGNSNVLIETLWNVNVYTPNDLPVAI